MPSQSHRPARAPDHGALEAQAAQIDAVLDAGSEGLAERWARLRGLVTPHFAREEMVIFPALDSGETTESSQVAMTDASGQHVAIHAAAEDLGEAAAGTEHEGAVARYAADLAAHAQEEDEQFAGSRLV